MRQAGNLLVNTKAVEPKYVEAMINSVKKNGPYIVVCPQTALPHANPEDGVLQEAVSIVRLKKPIDFHSGVNDPVSFIVAMSILSAQSINAAIYDMMLIFGNDKHRQHLMQFQDETEVYNYIESLEKL
ncbi:MAG: PTS sugar transporter subunit IIA [Erysipelotrichaceae bacterium]|nr:PTS sugar transporter subunit IIA [Erysipelotrichaceae bacterium]